MNDLDALLENSPYVHIPGASYPVLYRYDYCYACDTRIVTDEPHFRGGVECRKNYHTLTEKRIPVPDKFKTDDLPPFLRVE